MAVAMARVGVAGAMSIAGEAVVLRIHRAASLYTCWVLRGWILVLVEADTLAMTPVATTLPVTLQHLVPTVNIRHRAPHQRTVRTEVFTCALACARSACASSMASTLLLGERVNGTALAATVVTKPTRVVTLAATSAVIAAALIVAFQPQTISVVL